MNQNSSVLTFVIFALSFGQVQGQDSPPAYEHLESLGPLIGVWETDFDPPGPAPAGTLTVEFRWRGNKSYLDETVSFRPANSANSESMNPEFMIVGYDYVREKPYAMLFKYLSNGRLDASIDRSTLKISQEEGHGTDKFRSQSKTFAVDGNELVISSTHTVGNASPTSEPVLRLTKVD